MTIIVDFETTAEMAQALNESAGKNKVYRHPWNRFEPENTIWWLTTVPDWPAYRFGKAVCRIDDRHPDLRAFFCGLYVEKGYGAIVAEMSGSKAPQPNILEPGWIWFKLLDDLQNGKIAAAADTVAEQSGQPVILQLQFAYYDKGMSPSAVIEPGGADERYKDNRDRIWFDVAGETLTKIDERRVQLDLGRVADAQTLPDLAAALRAVPQADWIWFDFEIGVLVSPVGRQPSEGHIWDANDVWDRLYRPWLPWMT